MHRVMKLALAGVTGAGALLGLAWLGLQVQPRPFPARPVVPGPSAQLPVPRDLPPPVARYFRTAVGDHLPVVESAVVSGRGRLTFAGITFPARFRFIHHAGHDYRHYIETTWFGFPVLRVNEWFLDGHLRMELPFGVVEHEPKVDMAANLALWGESIWLPSILATDPRVRWEPVDRDTARLVVPFRDAEDAFTVRFDDGTGLIATMEARRYRQPSDAQPIPWHLKARGWESFHGIRIPTHAAVSWDRDPSWLVMTVEDVAYNLDVSEDIRASGP